MGNWTACELIWQRTALIKEQKQKPFRIRLTAQREIEGEQSHSCACLHFLFCLFLSDLLHLNIPPLYLHFSEGSPVLHQTSTYLHKALHFRLILPAEPELKGSFLSSSQVVCRFEPSISVSQEPSQHKTQFSPADQRDNWCCAGKDGRRFVVPNRFHTLLSLTWELCGASRHKSACVVPL